MTEAEKEKDNAAVRIPSVEEIEAASKQKIEGGGFGHRQGRQVHQRRPARRGHPASAGGRARRRTRAPAAAGQAVPSR